MAAVRDDGALKALVFCALNTFSETDSSFERRRASTSLSDSLSERAAGLVGVVVFLSSSAPVEGRGPVSRAMTTTTTTTTTREEKISLTEEEEDDVDDGAMIVLVDGNKDENKSERRRQRRLWEEEEEEEEEEAEEEEEEEEEQKQYSDNPYAPQPL